MTEQKGTEPLRSPEVFSTTNLRVALQARLMLSDEALSPTKVDLPKVTP